MLLQAWLHRIAQKSLSSSKHNGAIARQVAMGEGEAAEAALQGAFATGADFDTVSCGPKPALARVASTVTPSLSIVMVGLSSLSQLMSGEP